MSQCQGEGRAGRAERVAGPGARLTPAAVLVLGAGEVVERFLLDVTGLHLVFEAASPVRGMGCFRERGTCLQSEIAPSPSSTRSAASTSRFSP